MPTYSEILADEIARKAPKKKDAVEAEFDPMSNPLTPAVKGAYRKIPKQVREPVEGAAKDFLGHAINVIEAPMNAYTAIIAEEIRRKRAGEDGLGVVDMAKTVVKGVKESSNYDQVLPNNSNIARVLNIADPISFAFPWGTAMKGARAVGGTAKAVAGAGVGAAAAKSKPIAKAVEKAGDIRSLGDRKFKLKRMGVPEEMVQAEREHAGALNLAHVEGVGDDVKALRKMGLAPDRQRAVYEVAEIPLQRNPDLGDVEAMDQALDALRAERSELVNAENAFFGGREMKLTEPRKGSVPAWQQATRKSAGREKRIDEIDQAIADTQFKQDMLTARVQNAVKESYEQRLTRWQDAYSKLSPVEKQAHDLVIKIVREGTDKKLAGGVLDPERAKALEQIVGASYVPRLVDDPAKAIEVINEQIKRVEQGFGDEILKLDDAGADIGDIEGLMSAQEKEVARLVKMRAQFERVEDAGFRGFVAAHSPVGKKKAFQKKREIDKSLLEMGDISGIYNSDLAKLLGTDRIATAEAIADRAYVVKGAKSLKKEELLFTEKEKELLPFDTVKLPDAPNMPPEFKNMWVPKDIAQEMFHTVQGFGAPEKGIQVAKQVWQDYYHKPWRNITLFLAPEFFTRNVFTSTNNAYMKLGMGLDSIPEYRKAGQDVWRWFGPKKFGGTGIDNEAKNLIRKRVLHAGQSMEDRTILGEVSGRQSVLGLVSPFHTEYNPAIRLGHRVNMMIENQMRLAAYRHLRRKGLSESEAIGKVIDTHFDWELGLTRFERGARTVFPLFPWTRFNIPLQLEMIAHEPRRYVNTIRLLRAWQELSGGPDVDERTLPEWMSESAHIRTGYDPETGTSNITRLGGYLGAADLEKLKSPRSLGRELVSQVSPLPKWLAAWLGNIDVFRSTSDKLIQVDSGQAGHIFGQELSPKKEYALRQVRPINLMDRYLEAYEQGGPADAARRMVFGQSHQIDPDKSYRSYIKRVDMKIGQLTSQMRKARREKNYELADRKQEEINLLREEKRSVVRNRARRN